MGALRVCLFGRLDVRCDERILAGLTARRMQELICYLLLHWDRPHPREALASLLWSDCTTARSRRRLRQALWQIQTTLEAQAESPKDRVLLVDRDWVQVNPELDLWLDVAQFEQAFAVVQEVPGTEMSRQDMQVLEAAVGLYRGDLLEGWYQDWCLYERERLQNLYLAMLDKLVSYCEAHQRCETGLAYGARILRYDRAHERTHQRMMRLHCLAGNRTAALRQHEQCVTALEEELGVRPSRRTVALYEQIQAGQLNHPTLASTRAGAPLEMTTATLLEALECLKRIQAVLTNVQHRVQQGIQTVELTVNGQH